MSVLCFALLCFALLCFACVLSLALSRESACACRRESVFRAQGGMAVVEGARARARTHTHILLCSLAVLLLLLLLLLLFFAVTVVVEGLCVPCLDHHHLPLEHKQHPTTTQTHNTATKSARSTAAPRATSRA